jgi:hypothetical protein
MYGLQLTTRTRTIAAIARGSCRVFDVPFDIATRRIDYVRGPNSFDVRLDMRHS